MSPGGAGIWCATRAMEAVNLSVRVAEVAPTLEPEACSSSPSPGKVVGSTPGGAALPGREQPVSVFMVLVVTLLVLLIASTFLWNLLVLVTILRVRAFHRVPHNLVASTAVSDVLVAALVMPLSLVSELSDARRWRLGRSLCHVWTSFDVLCCTASIWNVAAIALDRYWTITRHLQYTPRTRSRTSALMIALTWVLSALIALAPMLFGWGEAYDAELQRCQVSQEPSYAVFSTCGAFYLPLGVVLFVYWKIYRAAKFRFGRGRWAVLPLPATVQVRAGLRSGGLKREVIGEGGSLVKGRVDEEACALGTRAESLATGALAAHMEFAVCSPEVHTEGFITCMPRSREVFITAYRARAGKRVSAPAQQGWSWHPRIMRLKGACRGGVSR